MRLLWVLALTKLPPIPANTERAAGSTLLSQTVRVGFLDEDGKCRKCRVLKRWPREDIYPFVENCIPWGTAKFVLETHMMQFCWGFQENIILSTGKHTHPSTPTHTHTHKMPFLHTYPPTQQLHDIWSKIHRRKYNPRSPLRPVIHVQPFLVLYWTRREERCRPKSSS